MKRLASLLTFCFLSLVLLKAQPPEPPTGKRWVFNENFSDEFNGTQLDTSKWYDHHPTWKGRPPGLFLPSTVKVGNGYMSITGGKLDRDTLVGRSTYNVACGAVVSKSTDAWFGYYECRFKAAATTMSTTFWFSSRAHFEGPEDCRDSYGLEWDVQECIGREGDFDGTYFASGMHSNSHFWYRDCEGKSHDYRAEQVLFESDKLASESFNTYGGWWKNEYEASYYYNNSEAKSHTFFTDIKEKPFDHTMGMNLVSETYPFPWISLPTDEELADPTKNTCYYDWVRAYTLVDVDRAGDSESLDWEKDLFEEQITFREKPDQLEKTEIPIFLITYASSENGEIFLEVLDERGRVLGQKTGLVYWGYGKKELKLSLNSALKKGRKYTAQIRLRPEGADQSLKSWDSDKFSFSIQ